MLNALLLLLSLLATGTDTRPKQPRLVARVRAAETSVWVIWTVTNNQVPDSTVVLITATNLPTVRRRYFAAVTKTDSANFALPVPAAPISGSISAIAYKQGWLPSPPGVKGWGYTPTLEQPGVGEIIVRPAAWTVDPDPAGACARWQASNPTVSPFITVNVKAVPTCTGTNNAPMVIQGCAFARLADGQLVQCLPLPRFPSSQAYCAAELASLRATVRS